jgi:hypothetical protein
MALIDDKGKDSGDSIKVIRAGDVVVPVTATQPKPPSAEVVRIWDDFVNGKDITRVEMQRVLLHASEGGGNGNCGIC